MSPRAGNLGNPPSLPVPSKLPVSSGPRYVHADSLSSNYSNWKHDLNGKPSSWKPHDPLLPTNESAKYSDQSPHPKIQKSKN